jgi:hypothetical protein
VTITDATPGAVIYYMRNGITPTANSLRYTGPIAVSSSDTIKATAIAAGGSLSPVAAAAYVIEPQTATPAFSLPAGQYAVKLSVTLACPTVGATIYYTTNGSTPTTSSTRYTGAITVSSTQTLKAIATATGYTTSAVATAAYTITSPAATPTFSPMGGTYTTQQTVTISDATAGATIYYTTNGSTPTTSSTKYTGTITISATETLRAVAIAPGYALSKEATVVYKLPSN